MAVRITVSMIDPISTNISRLFSYKFIIIIIHINLLLLLSIYSILSYRLSYYACGGLGPPHRNYVRAWGPHTILLNRAPTSVNPALLAALAQQSDMLESSLAEEEAMR